MTSLSDIQRQTEANSQVAFREPAVIMNSDSTEISQGHNFYPVMSQMCTVIINSNGFQEKK